jgi:hypothetical protein
MSIRPSRHQITGRIENREFGHSRDAFPIEIRCLGLNDVTLQDGEPVVWGVKPEGRSFAVVNRLADNRVHRVPNFQPPFRASQSIGKSLNSLNRLLAVRGRPQLPFKLSK